MKAAYIVDVLLEGDIKDLALRATTGLPPDSTVVFKASFTDVGASAPTPHVARPNYYSTDFGDWQLDWNQASQFRLGDYIHDGVIDLNDFPFGTESVIVLNQDGSPGKEYSFDDLSIATAEVIDSYVSPEQDNEDDREQNPDEYYPRARRV